MINPARFNDLFEQIPSEQAPRPDARLTPGFSPAATLAFAVRARHANRALMSPAADDTQIDIALGFDAKYAPHAAACVASVHRHAGGAELRFIIIHAGVEAPLRAKVEQAAPGARFVWIEARAEDLPPFADRGYFNRSILFRLGLDKLAPADCGRLLYLDADLIVLSGIRALWRTDLKGFALAAAIDSFQDEHTFAQRWALPAGGQYFNSGVLLIDLARVRQEGLFAAALEFVIRNGILDFPDQDALNAVFWNRWLRLDNNWNIQRHMLVAEGYPSLPAGREMSQAPAGIVHFTCAEKPWLAGVWHPWSWVYWDNLARTPFLAEVAREHGVSFYRRLRMRLRWLRRRPAVR